MTSKLSSVISVSSVVKKTPLKSDPGNTELGL